MEGENVHKKVGGNYLWSFCFSAPQLMQKPVPIGTVSSLQKQLQFTGTNLVPGTTIFSGETTIHVGGPRPGVWIAVEGGGQVQVSENSTGGPERSHPIRSE